MVVAEQNRGALGVGVVEAADVVSNVGGAAFGGGIGRFRRLANDCERTDSAGLTKRRHIGRSGCFFSRCYPRARVPVWSTR
jgi:hypothetical protein